jgi:hypothetical protein
MALLDWERIFVLGEILLETAVITDFMCPSVNRYRLLVLLLFTREKNCSHTYVLPNIAIIILIQKTRVKEIFILASKNKNLATLFQKTFGSG